ncbi:MAG: hypothetical protein AB8F95_07950 [Bacteroidia bacterium]
MKRLAAISLILCLYSQLICQTPLFTNDDPIQITLAVDMAVINSERSVEENEYIDARISLNESSTVKDLKGKVKVGGNFRKDPTNCSLPPIRLKFKKKNISGSLFTGNTKLKLVCPCAGADYVLKEYLVYKFYQLLSPMSFNVRLVEVNLVDIGGKIKTQKFTGFFIEDDDRVAERTGTLVEKPRIKQDDFERKHITQLALFQYAMGNRDWDLVLQKNIKRLDRAEEHYALPYDFDFSGIVAPPYVISRMGDDINDMRYFPPLCRKADEFLEVFPIFKKAIPEWEKLTNELKGISKSQRNNMLRYIKTFSKKLNNPEKFAARLVKRCTP